ncbi:MAG: hypothetical protein WAV89_15440 [Ignavibacteriaceae bacterium]
MKFNNKQKRILVIGLLLSLAALIIWLGFGAEIFTKTQVLVEKKDDLFGTNYKEWKEQFVLGLDYTLGFIGAVFVLNTFLIWKTKTRTKT